MRFYQFMTGRKYSVGAGLIIGLVLISGLIYLFWGNIDIDLGRSNIPKDAEPIERYFHENIESFVKTEAEVSREEGGTFYFSIYRTDEFAVAIREVWDGGELNTPEVRYYFFDQGQLALVKRFKGEAGGLDRLREGSDHDTTVQDKLFFENGAMWKWVGPDDVERDSSDPRWADLERFTLLSVNYYSTGLNETGF